MEHIFKLELKDIVSKKEGYFLSRVFVEASELAESIVSNMSALVLNVLWFVIGSLFAFSLSPYLTIITWIFIPLHLFVDVHFGNQLKVLNWKLKELQGDAYKQISVVLRFAPIIHLMDMINFIYQFYSGVFTNYLEHTFNLNVKAYRYSLVSNIVENIFRLFLLFTGGIFIIKHKLSIGGYIGFSGLIWQVIKSSEGIFSIIGNIYTVNSTLDRFENLRAKGAQKCNRLYISEDNTIELIDVSFGYDENKMVIKDMNIFIKQGQKVLIFGPNGSGKTTLCYLISGLLCPNSGKIKTLPVDKFSFVPTNMPVLPGNIVDQITFGLNERTERFKKFNAFFNLDFNESGNLSQGELKKVNLLRTFVKEAEVYIFDEPFQSLDVQSIEVVKRLLMDLKDKTVIIVSHRRDLINDMEFDKIIKL